MMEVMERQAGSFTEPVQNWLLLEPDGKSLHMIKSTKMF